MREARDSSSVLTAALDIGSMVVLAGLAIAIPLGVYGPARTILVLAFATLVPGWSFSGLLIRFDVGARLPLAIGISLATTSIAATITVWVHAWHPFVLLLLLAAASVALIAYQSPLAWLATSLTAGGDMGRVLRAELRRFTGSVALTLGWCGRHLSRWDAVFLLALGLWTAALPGTRPEQIHDLGLLSAVPRSFFAAPTLLTASFVGALTSSRISAVRLVLHLVALVMMLHGTLPVVMPRPDYAFVYKHFGVVQHISVSGSADDHLDIYQDWPGFFAAAAWLDDVAGVSNPMAYASWASVYFNLLTLPMIAFAIRPFNPSPRVCWLALFLFVTGNWVGQDYFAPQAFGFVLSICVIGAILNWFCTDRPRRPAARHTQVLHPMDLSLSVGRRHSGTITVDLTGRPRPSELNRSSRGTDTDRTEAGASLQRRLPARGVPARSRSSVPMRTQWWGADLEMVGGEEEEGRPAGGQVIDGHDQPRDLWEATPSRQCLVAVTYLVFAAVVFAHALSPYMVIIWVGGLTVSGSIRPRWLVVGLAVIALTFLGSRADYVDHNLGLISFNVLGNAHNGSVGLNQGQPGRLVAAYAARFLSLGMWALGLLGAVSGYRRHTLTLTPSILMVAPAVIFLGVDYGGEGLYRVFLFSLPWTALLAATVIVPASVALPAMSRAVGGALRVGAVSLTLICLFLPAYFGLETVNRMRPDEVAASQYFYAHAQRGSVLVLAVDNFPSRLSGDYDSFVVDNAGDPILTSDPRFRSHFFTPADLPDVAADVRGYEDATPVGYLAISTGMKDYSRFYKTLPDGSLDSLDYALASSPDWRPFYRNRNVAIYQLSGPPQARAGEQLVAGRER